MPENETPTRRRMRLLAAAATLAVVLTNGGCAGKAAPKPQPPPPTPDERGFPDPAPVPSPAEAPAEADAAAPETADSEETQEGLVVLEPGGEPPGEGTRSLVEAARAERARRSQAPEPEIVITDKNLAEYASGELTIAAPEPDGGEEASDPEATAQGPNGAALGPRDEEYWRSRGLQIRLDWRAAAERIADLENRVSELRTRFYAEDDGFYRDSQIKPAWDRAIDELDRARADVERHRQELEAFLEEGRRAGALPGWLREGLEYEPEPPAEPSAIHEPGEPPVAEEPGEGG